MITGMTVRSSDGSAVELVVPETPPPAGELRALLRRDQCALWSDRYVPDGSFSMIGGRGADNWIRLEDAESELILNVPPNRALEQWAFTPAMGRIYTYADDPDNDGDYESARWPVILISSTFTDIQRVRVLKIEQRQFLTPLGNFIKRTLGVVVGAIYQAAALIDSIPYQASGDYSAFMPDKHPEYWLSAWTDYKSSPPTYGPSHNEFTFRMPLFNPSTFPTISGSARDIGGFWVDARVLGPKG